MVHKTQGKSEVYGSAMRNNTGTVQEQIPQTAQAVTTSNSLYTLTYIHSVYIAKPPPTPTRIFDPFLWLTLVLTRALIASL